VTDGLCALSRPFRDVPTCPDPCCPPWPLERFQGPFLSLELGEKMSKECLLLNCPDDDWERFGPHGEILYSPLLHEAILCPVTALHGFEWEVNRNSCWSAVDSALVCFAEPGKGYARPVSSVRVCVACMEEMYRA
jgi:hypothetical protein